MIEHDRCSHRASALMTVNDFHNIHTMQDACRLGATPHRACIDFVSGLLLKPGIKMTSMVSEADRMSSSVGVLLGEVNEI